MEKNKNKNKCQLQGSWNPRRARAEVSPAQQGDPRQRLGVWNRNKHKTSLGAKERGKTIDSHVGLC